MFPLIHIRILFPRGKFGTRRPICTTIVPSKRGKCNSRRYLTQDSEILTEVLACAVMKLIILAIWFSKHVFLSVNL
jgi:hypothetical protein